MEQKYEKIEFNMPSIVFLCGMPGCGKTSTAKKVSKQLQWKCIDLDNYISEITSKSPSKWIVEHGEEAFRKIESDTLQQLVFNENTIVSVGGGTPCFYNNLEWMQHHGTCIYIDMPVKALWSRVAAKGFETRPLLGNEQEALQKLIDLFEIRKPFYEQITWKESGLSLDVKLLAEKIKASFY
jgi:shikimate kinase